MNILYNAKNVIKYSLALLFSLSIVSTTFASEDEKWALICPDDVVVNCNDELWDLDQYGTAYVHDYLGYTPLQPYSVDYNIGECGTGTIVRTWVAEDYQWNWHSCTQTIFVTGGIFDGYDIDWPNDIVLEECDPATDPGAFPSGYNYPTFDDVDCAMPLFAYDDQVFVVNSHCKKILRTWTVIDCCTYHPNGYNGSGGYMGTWNPYGGWQYGTPGIWTHVQIIKVTVGDAPEIECPADITVDMDGSCSGAYVNIPIPNAWGQCGPDVTIVNNSPYADSNGANASGHYPVGTTQVMFTAKDGCFKETICKIYVTVLKNKPPSPVCHHGLSAALMPVDTDGDGLPDDGMVEIPASFFDASSFHACYNTPLYFSYSSDVYNTTRIFTCEDVGEQEVEIWVTDMYGNQSYCVTYIEIQNNNANIPDCDPPPPPPDTSGLVSGLLMTPYDVEVVDANMVVTQFGVDTIVSTYTDTVYVELIDTVYGEVDTQYIVTIDTLFNNVEDIVIVNVNDTIFLPEGAYHIPSLEMGGSYLLTPEKAPDGLAGVDASDMVRLIHHLQGTDTLDTPHLLLAADINDDKLIDADDFMDLHNIINGGDMGADLPPLTWEFSKAGYVWANPTFPFTEEFPTSIYIEELNTAIDGLNFIGFKKGDLVPTLADHNPVHGKVQAVNWNATDQNVKTGELVSMQISSEESSIIGFEFTIESPANSIETPMIEENGWSVIIKEVKDFDDNIDTWTISAFGMNKLRSSNDGLFNLTFKANTDASVSQLISINSSVMSAKSFSLNGMPKSILLRFDTQTSDLHLSSNAQKPFSETTVINYFVPENGTVELSIYAVSGRQILNEVRELERGLYERQILKRDLAGPGVYYYELTYKNQKISKKMILID